jgi:two-component system, sensor histidine kinase RegB
VDRDGAGQALASQAAMTASARWTARLAAMLQGEEGRLRIGTLNVMRWLALGGQTATLLFAALGLGLSLPLTLCLAVVAAGIAVTLAASLLFPASRRLSDAEATVYLALDQVQLAAILALTGGVENPFTLLLLVQVVVAASALNLRFALGLAAFTLALITALAIWHFPLPWLPGQVWMPLPPLYVAGIWIALVMALGFTVIITFRVAAESSRLSAAFAAMELALAREQKLAALGALAAAAAHELGTPLGTIALVSKELARSLPQDGLIGEDLRLLRAQVDRCRDILARLAKPGLADEAGPAAHLPLLALLDDIAEPSRGGRVEILVSGSGDTAVSVRALPELRYAIGNLIENAADFAERRVTVSAAWDAARVVVRIRDDGPGFSPDIVTKLGQPYVTTRPGRSALSEEELAPSQPHQTHDGMGLGFFIAKTLLERTGAEVGFANAAAGGALVTMTWPRHRIAAAPNDPVWT